MDIVKKIRSLESFHCVSEATIKVLATRCRHVEVVKSDFLFQSSQCAEYVYFVLYGSFKLQDGESLKDIVIYDFAGRGEFFGMIHSILRTPTYPFSAVANEDSAVLEIPLADFNDLLTRCPDFSNLLQKYIAQRFGEIVHDRKISRLLVSQRLADFLLRTLKRSSLSCGGRIAIPLTRVDLARKLVAKEETVIRLLTAWTRQGWITTDHKHIEIFKPVELEKIILGVIPKGNLDEVVLSRGHKRLR